MNMSHRVWTRALASATFVAMTAVAPVWAADAQPTFTVQPQTMKARFVLEGQLQAVRQATVAAQASGRVMTMRVKAGDYVKAGQIMADIDDRMTQAGAAQSNAVVAQAQSHFKRTQELRQQGFVSQAALDDAKAQLDIAMAGNTQAKLAQGYTRVMAPFEGWVLSTHIEAGDLAAPGVPVAIVYQPGSLRAVVHVPASRLQSQKLQNAVIRFDDGSTAKPIRMVQVPVADAVSQTIEWRADLSAADAKNRLPGQAVSVEFTGTGSQQGLSIPEKAVVKRGEITAVYVRLGEGDAARYALRAIRTGSKLGADHIEVIAGLKAGDVVSLTPLSVAR